MSESRETLETRAIREAGLPESGDPTALEMAISVYLHKSKALAADYTFAAKPKFGDSDQLAVLRLWRSKLSEAAAYARRVFFSTQRTSYNGIL